MYCLKCGKQLPEDARFCLYCGAKMPEIPKAQPASRASAGTYSYVPPKNTARDVVYEPVQSRPQPQPKPQSQRAPELFCASCGSKMQPQDKFCLNCGSAAGAPGHRPAAAAEKPKKSKRKIIGWILIILEMISLFGSYSNGSLEGIFAIQGAGDVFYLLGYFLPAIIGIWLLTTDKNK